MENNDYIKFAKMYLEKAIIDSIREKTKNNDLTIDSELKNEFGDTVYLKNEITDFIEVLGDELIKDFDNITNKIDEYFFTYKYKSFVRKQNNIEQEKINYTQFNDKQEKEIEHNLAIKLNNEIDNTKEKIVHKINFANIEEIKKFSLKKITEDLFKNLKNKILKVLGNDLELKGSLDSEMKYELLKSENLSSKILESLSNDKDVSILRKVAIHQNTNEKTLEKIFKNTKDFKVLENLLKNENTPTKIINELSKNEDKDIRLLAFENKNISQDLLVKHSKSQDLDLINSILNNKNISEKVLENIINSNFKDTTILKKISDIIDKNFENEPIADKDTIEKIKELKNKYPQGTLIRLENIDNMDIQVGTIAFINSIDNNGKANIICSNGIKINIDLNKDNFQKIEMRNLSITQQFSVDSLRQKLFKNNDMKEKLENKMTKNNTIKL